MVCGFRTAPAAALFPRQQDATPSSGLIGLSGSGDAAGAPQFELLAATPARAAAAAAGFASLTTSLLGRQQEQQQQQEGRRLLPQVPIFELARAAAGPAIETGLRVIRVAGDGRCMFRALAQGLARNQGRFLAKSVEEQEADQLRLAVADALCRTAARRNQFAVAVYAVEAEDKMQNYCRRIVTPTFWGGEPELLVLSQMLHLPIYVYISSRDARRPGAGGRGGGYVAIQKYGDQYSKPDKKGKVRRAVRLLYSGSNHYDLLLK